MPYYSEDDSEDDIKLPYNELIRMYNQEYSLMLAETKKFFTEVYHKYKAVQKCYYHDLIAQQHGLRLQYAFPTE